MLLLPAARAAEAWTTRTFVSAQRADYVRLLLPALLPPPRCYRVCVLHTRVLIEISCGARAIS